MQSSGLLVLVRLCHSQCFHRLVLCPLVSNSKIDCRLMFSHLISSCVTQPCPPHITLRATMAKRRHKAAAGRAPQILHKYYNSPLHLQSAVCLSGDTVISAYLDSLCVTGITVQRSSTNNTVHFHLLSNWVRGVLSC